MRRENLKLNLQIHYSFLLITKMNFRNMMARNDLKCDPLELYKLGSDCITNSERKIGKIRRTVGKPEATMESAWV